MPEPSSRRDALARRAAALDIDSGARRRRIGPMNLLRILAVLWLALGMPLTATARVAAHSCGDQDVPATQSAPDTTPAAAAVDHHGHHPLHAIAQTDHPGETSPAGHAHHPADQNARDCCASHGCCDSGLCTRHACTASPSLLLPAAQHPFMLAGPVAEPPIAPGLRAPAPGFHATPLRPPA